MTTMSDDSPPRAAERLAWARAALADPAVGLERASVDAGFRSYWRAVGHVPGAAVNSAIVMDSPPDKEDVRPWLRIRDLLEAGGVRVPHVLARDAERGFLLLEDLGTHTCLQVLTPDNADAVFDAAIEQLLLLQTVAPPADLPAYDEALLARELRLFDEWFLGRHLGMTLDCEAMEVLDGAYRALIDAALAQPRVFVHRDFMPRNLMPVEGGVAVLDFQDAVHGPIAYDVLSLFKDAFASWPEARVVDWIARYHARATQAGLPVPELARFRRDADWIGVQRHLKVIGIFARLNHRDHKPKYLQDVPRFFAYLDAVLPHYREFDALRALIDTRVRPAMAAQAATA
jgi:aminoglycoside/choline kinase family phosphotransferase